MIFEFTPLASHEGDDFDGPGGGPSYELGIK
jgi:hypothetical protein